MRRRRPGGSAAQPGAQCPTTARSTCGGSVVHRHRHRRTSGQRRPSPPSATCPTTSPDRDQEDPDDRDEGEFLDPPCAVCAGVSSHGTSTQIQVGARRRSAPRRAGRAILRRRHADGRRLRAGADQHDGAEHHGPAGGSDVAPNQRTPASAASSSRRRHHDAEVAREQNGTYYQGTDGTSPAANGIVFVDTPSGNVLTNSSPSSDLITVNVRGNWSSGWNGCSWSPAPSMSAQHHDERTDLRAERCVAARCGQRQHHGRVISTNRVDAASTNVDTMTSATRDHLQLPVRTQRRRDDPAELVRENPERTKRSRAPETRGLAPGRRPTDGCWMPAAVIFVRPGDDRGRSRRRGPQGVRAADWATPRRIFRLAIEKSPEDLGLHYMPRHDVALVEIASMIQWSRDPRALSRWRAGNATRRCPVLPLERLRPRRRDRPRRRRTDEDDGCWHQQPSVGRARARGRESQEPRPLCTFRISRTALRDVRPPLRTDGQL